MKITSPRDAFAHLHHLLRADAEEFWALALSSEKELLASACLFRGTVDGCSFHPRDVFRFAYAQNASGLIVAHNHPTGHARPSPHDDQVTERLFLTGELLQVPLVDHLILARKTYFSYEASGELARLRALTAAAPGDRSPD